MTACVILFSFRFLVSFLLMMFLCCAGASSRKHVHDDHGFAAKVNSQDTLKMPKPFQTTTVLQGSTDEMKRSVDIDDHHHEVKKIIGSSPPSCENKCYGCMPCEAIQVPTISGISSHRVIGIQYTNYEPEGWKCKCGPTLFSP